MAYELCYKASFEQQKSKRPVSTSISSPPPLPKRSRTKVQGRKAFVDGVLNKKSNRSFGSGSSNFSIPLLCSKVIHLLPGDSLQRYQEMFFKKLVDPEYYVDLSAEVELRAKFLKPFGDHNLLKFTGMKKKYNPNYVKAFYYNLELTTVGLESRFKDKIVKFDCSDFTKYFGLSYTGSDMSIKKCSRYDKIPFVLSISKSFVKNWKCQTLA